MSCRDCDGSPTDAQLLALRRRVETLELAVRRLRDDRGGDVVLIGAEADAWRAVRAALGKEPT